jgi:CheY-like chemotaxis protein
VSVQSPRLARILIVDGDPASREPLERAFEDEGLEVLSAADAEGAWEAFATFGPQAAVLGRRLPRVAVEELASRMQEADPELLVLGATEPWGDLARRLRIRLGAPAPRSLPPAVPEATPGTTRVLRRPPLESGELEFGALPDLLVRLWRTAADGIVAVDHPGGSDLVFLLRGAPVGVQLAGERSAVDVGGALASLCGRGARTYAYHPGADFALEVRGAPVPALAPLLEGLRRAADEPSYAAALASFEDVVPVRSGAFAALARDLAPAGDDARAVAALGGGLPIRSLLDGPGRPASLLWFLIRSGALLLEPAEPDRASPVAEDSRRGR